MVTGYDSEHNNTTEKTKMNNIGSLLIIIILIFHSGIVFHAEHDAVSHFSSEARQKFEN